LPVAYFLIMSSFGKSLCAKTEKARRIMINKELNPY